LLHDAVEVFPLPDADGGAVCLVAALERGCISFTAINAYLLGETIAADRLLEKL
jgi:hypothetical protein